MSGRDGLRATEGELTSVEPEDEPLLANFPPRVDQHEAEGSERSERQSVMAEEQQDELQKDAMGMAVEARLVETVPAR